MTSHPLIHIDASAIHRGYFSLVKSLQCTGIVFAAFALVHVFAPANSYAGTVLVEILQSPSVVLYTTIFTALVSMLYFYRFAATYHLTFDEELVLRKGNLVTSTTKLLPSKVNHVATNSSVIEQMLGLTTIHIYTAGSEKPTLLVPNVAKDNAAIFVNSLRASI